MVLKMVGCWRWNIAHGTTVRLLGMCRDIDSMLLGKLSIVEVKRYVLQASGHHKPFIGGSKLKFKVIRCCSNIFEWQIIIIKQLFRQEDKLIDKHRKVNPNRAGTMAY